MLLFLLLFFLRFLLLIHLLFFIFTFKNAEPLSGAVASPSTLKAGIASSPFFSLLDLSWSRSVGDTRFARFVIAYFLTHLCHIVAWGFWFAVPALDLFVPGAAFTPRHPFLKILNYDVFGVFGHFWDPQVNACPGPILRVSWFWIFLYIFIIILLFL